ncbi:DMT family transporter [Leucobacter sp. gxy201]|uniref:DMT family transporter n=1 Tax=Leucobacter sp. gxy201 TaxID=2957200 RepID=UPI003DA1837F
MHRDRTIGIAMLTIASLAWGTTGTAATFAPGVGPLAIGAAALGIGGILQALIALPQLRANRHELRARAGIVMFGAIAVAIYPLAFYSSMHFAGVAIGSVVSLASAPIASGLLERLVDGTGLGPWWWFAVGLGIIGSAALCASRATMSTGSFLETTTGVALGLAAGASYAAYSWSSYRLMRAGVGRAASMGAVFGLGGMLLMPVLALTGAPIFESPGNMAVAAYMALVPMFLGYVLFGVALTRVSASTATTVTLLEPAIATVLAVLIVGERLGPLGWAGLGCIAIVLVVLTLAPGAESATTNTAARTTAEPASRAASVRSSAAAPAPPR